MNVFHRTRVILNCKESVQVLEEIRRRGEAIALDCEGVNLSTPSKGKYQPTYLLTEIVPNTVV